MTVIAELRSPISAIPRPSARTTRRALIVTLLCLAALSISIWFSRELMLRGVAALWIVSDEVQTSDAVAIFGGGIATRPFAAAEYYRQGLVKKILISDVRLNKSEALGGLASHAELNRAVLIKLGIPETDIESFGTGLSNTHEEAVALRDWAARNHARRIIVPTEVFSARRVRWALNHEPAGTGTQFAVPALEDPEYETANWWKNEKGFIAFLNEVSKYVYYRIKY